MDRRSFLGACVGGLSVAISGAAVGQPSAGASTATFTAGPALLFADPHAHPYQFFGSRSYDYSTPTLPIMKKVGMALSSFSAVGDMTYSSRSRSGSAFSDTQDQLRKAMRFHENGELRLITKGADVATLTASPQISAGFLAIEGADALEGRLANLDAFYADGVRFITLIHERDNELGTNQRSGNDGPLSAFGAQVIERMNALGMVVDVAHAKRETLKGIAQVCATPLIDSHTSPHLPGEEGSGIRRLRTWAEMELVAKSGGIVCTWPLAFTGKSGERTSLEHWAAEFVLMKSRLGIEHCGIGTDGGGGLPRLVKGWESIASLPALVEAMRGAGFSQDEIAAIVGGNFLRLFAKCLA